MLSTLYDSPDLKYGKLANQDLKAPRRDMYLSFVAMVEQEFKGIHTVKKYADRLGVSQRVLSLCTHYNVNKTPLTIINERLLLEAKRNLRFTTLSVSEIAYDLGYINKQQLLNLAEPLKKNQYGKYLIKRANEISGKQNEIY